MKVFLKKHRLKPSEDFDIIIHAKRGAVERLAREIADSLFTDGSGRRGMTLLIANVGDEHKRPNQLPGLSFVSTASRIERFLKGELVRNLSEVLDRLRSEQANAEGGAQ